VNRRELLEKPGKTLGFSLSSYVRN